MGDVQILPVETESDPLKLPPRSILYSIDPMGVGTPDCESLSSYINRLAQAHCISAPKLIETVILPASDYLQQAKQQERIKICDYWRRPCNGTVRIARLFVQALEKLTLRTDIANLTMLPWHKAIDPAGKGLLKHDKSWCPLCYEEQRTIQEPVHDKLLWHIEHTEKCIRHNAFLASKCPSCMSSQQFFTSYTKLGHCSRCGQWLGRSSSHQNHSIASSYKTRIGDNDNWFETSIGEMISCSPRLPLDFNSSYFYTAMKRIIETTGGKSSQLSRTINFNEATLSQWIREKNTARLDLLVDFCYRIKVTPANFLLHNFQIEMLPLSDTPKMIWMNYYENKPGSLPSIKNILIQYLESTPPLSMHAISKQIRIGVGFLSYHWPDLVRKISKRFLQNLKKERQQKREAVKNATKSVIESLFEKGLPPSKRLVRQELKSHDHYGNNEKANKLWRESLNEIERLKSGQTT